MFTTDCFGLDLNVTRLIEIWPASFPSVNLTQLISAYAILLDRHSRYVSFPSHFLSFDQVFFSSQVNHYF